MDQEVILSGVSEVCLINMYELIKKALEEAVQVEDPELQRRKNNSDLRLEAGR